MSFSEVLGSLAAIDFEGGAFVELSRRSHDAVETARKALAFLRDVR
jgi:L-ribulose-5-phosphate 3-epimerase